MTDPVTLTLPFLTHQGLHVLLVTLCLAGASVLIWRMLRGEGRDRQSGLDRWLAGMGWILGAAWLWLLAGTLWGLWQVFNGVQDGPLSTSSVSLGALIAAFLGAPFVIYGTWLKHKANRLEQEGHMTDRILRAVEQLGAEKLVKQAGREESVPNIEVRIGAILSLERIAQDSTTHDKGRDHVRVMEILCAYIRENSNARKPVDFPLPDWTPLDDDATEEERAAHLEWRKARFDKEFGPLARQWAQTLPEPRADVQLELTVIGRRSADQRRVEAAWPNAPTRKTVWPFDTDFKRLPDEPGDTPLGTAELAAFKAGLGKWQAKLHDYRGYRLDLRGANLQGADMAAQQPDGSDAVFSAALFKNTRMEGANLRQARMDSATSLMGATLRGAALREVDYSSVEISEEQVASTFGDASVTLPKGVARPAHWADWELPRWGKHGFRSEWHRWQADPEGYKPLRKPD